MTALSVRRLWTRYEQVLARDGVGKRDLVFAQGAFHAGPRCTLKVLGYLLEQARLMSCARRSGRKADRSRPFGDCALGRRGTEWRGLGIRVTPGYRLTLAQDIEIPSNLRSHL